MLYVVVVIALVVLGLVLVKEIPNVPAPLNWALPVAIVVAGIVALASKLL